MKKILVLFLTVTIILSLSACGQKEDFRNDVLGDLDFSHTEKHEDEKQDENTNSSETETVIPNAQSTLKMGKEYDGLYTIGNYMSFSVDGQKYMTLDIHGVDVENSGAIDATRYDIPDCLSDIKEYIYLDIEFNNKKMSIDIVTRDTKESLSGMDTNEIISKIFFEFQGELKNVGNIPTEDIYMSNYQPGNVYVFDIPENKLKDYEIPNSINDTEHDVVLYTIKNNEGEINDRVFVFQNSFNSDNRQFVLLPDSTDGKIYMGVAVATPEMVAKDNKLIKLSNYEVNDKINIGVNEIIHNNTEKTITINVKAGEDTKVMKINPNCMANVSFIYDVTVSNIE